MPHVIQSERGPLILHSSRTAGCSPLRAGKDCPPREMAFTTTYRPRSGSLSERECEVLEQIARGQSIEDISASLFLSPHTVRTHIKNILRKMGARTRAHAVAMAISEEIIDRRRVGVR